MEDLLNVWSGWSNSVERVDFAANNHYRLNEVKIIFCFETKNEHLHF